MDIFYSRIILLTTTIPKGRNPPCLTSWDCTGWKSQVLLRCSNLKRLGYLCATQAGWTEATFQWISRSFIGCYLSFQSVILVTLQVTNKPSWHAFYINPFLELLFFSEYI
jgi:hypothetical protein